ncbi:MAG: Hyaluronan synthase [Myxococcaceae bacterium]|jgi:cellulose synthase/poly-beta-1,6-N-acetylglucosamine synthase-like glycosyltransferase|nr:Hyaluronan synthase [Myxococcaceae bacterium]MEA2748527.1 N-acetylglucosaminyltransferase [Myxococcales bacterium]
MELFPVYLLFFIVFVNRYVIALLVKSIDGMSENETNDTFEPTVTVVVPLFNEGKQIYDTLQSLLALDYPHEKLSIIVVDDRSTDDSWMWAQKAAAENPRVTAIRNAHNMGKRRGINNAVRHATSEIIVSVDSDVIVDSMAVRRLVRRFTDKKVAAVGGRVHVLNANENWLTRMQAIKYWFGYEYMKDIERSFKSVMCLSGCLTAYRRDVLIELEPILENRRLFGVEIKYGEDRFLTRQIIKRGYQTVFTLDAVCWTIAPKTLGGYFNQQLRWRRSNIIDFIGGVTHSWKLHPVVAIHYLGLFAILFSYPMVVFHSIVRGTFWQGATLHGLVLAFLGVVYAFQTRHYPPEAKVHPLWFMGMTVVMPVTYLIATPLAIFTLDSSSWETRGHGALKPADQAPVLVPVAEEIVFRPSMAPPSRRPHLSLVPQPARELVPGEIKRAA